jgi:hypothetical protein
MKTNENTPCERSHRAKKYFNCIEAHTPPADSINNKGSVKPTGHTISGFSERNYLKL